MVCVLTHTVCIVTTKAQQTLGALWSVERSKVTGSNASKHVQLGMKCLQFLTWNFVYDLFFSSVYIYLFIYMPVYLYNLCYLCTNYIYPAQQLRTLPCGGTQCKTCTVGYDINRYMNNPYMLSNELTSLWLILYKAYKYHWHDNGYVGAFITWLFCFTGWFVDVVMLYLLQFCAEITIAFTFCEEWSAMDFGGHSKDGVLYSVECSKSGFTFCKEWSIINWFCIPWKMECCRMSLLGVGCCRVVLHFMRNRVLKSGFAFCGELNIA